jgi:curli production assembly/transport component CsgE
MKRWIPSSLLVIALAANAEPFFEIGGLMVDQTLSPVGHLFYEQLVDAYGFEISAATPTITVHERPDTFAGNVIWIEVNDNVVFEDRVGTRLSGVEEKAQTARTQLESYLLQHKETLRGLEIY